MARTSSRDLALAFVGALGAAMVAFAVKHREELQDAVARAEAELARWRAESWSETDPGAQSALADYWRAVGLAPQSPDVPWSAAFVSYVAKDDGLQPSGSHIGYTRAAWRARQSSERGRYWAFQPSEVTKLQAGDVVVRERGDTPTGWADVVEDTGFRPTHGDVVVSTPETSSDDAFAIGGNLSNRVEHRQIPGSPSSDPGVFAVLRRVV